MGTDRGQLQADWQAQDADLASRKALQQLLAREEEQALRHAPESMRAKARRLGILVGSTEVSQAVVNEWVTLDGGQRVFIEGGKIKPGGPGGKPIEEDKSDKGGKGKGYVAGGKSLKDELLEKHKDRFKEGGGKKDQDSKGKDAKEEPKAEEKPSADSPYWRDLEQAAPKELSGLGRLGKSISDRLSGFAKRFYDSLDNPTADGGLGPRVGGAAKKLVDWGLALHHKLDKAYDAGQRLAHAVAKERGLSDFDANRAAKMLATADAVGRWTTWKAAGKAGMLLGAVGGPVGIATAGAAAKLSYYVPAASLAYVGFQMGKEMSEGKNPLALISRARGRIRSTKAQTPPTTNMIAYTQLKDWTADVGEWLAQADDSDYAEALLVAALDETRGDKSKALELSRKALKSSTESTANAFCPTGEGGGIDNSCGKGGIPKPIPASSLEVLNGIPLDKILGDLARNNCGTGAGGFQHGNTCAAGGSGVHAGSGLSIGHTITKRYKGTTYTLEVTPNGFRVSIGSIPQAVYGSLSAAANGIRNSNTSVNGWKFFGVARPSTPTGTASTPTKAPLTPPPAQVHKSGLVVGSTYTKSHQGGTHTVTVTPNGFEVRHSDGTTKVYSSLSAAAQGVKGTKVAVNGWAFFKIAKPTNQTPATPPTPVTSIKNEVPFQDKVEWSTGNIQSGQGLHGIPFASAPPKFWEKVKDVDVKEPKPIRKIERALVMIQEPDGRVWIVKPTNGFGGRNYSIPGGTIEKGLTLQQNALKETWEETGLQVEITGYLADIPDSNYSGSNGNFNRYGRVYLAKRIGGAPWDAKVEPNIINHSTGKPDAESESVLLVTKERAAQLLHRTDDLAMLGTVEPIKLGKAEGGVVSKLVEGLKPAAEVYKKREESAGRYHGSIMMHAAQELRGFNAKPKVVSKNEMDKLANAGTHIEMLRGVVRAGSRGSQELAESFRTGDHYPGFGSYGNGTYADSSKGSRNAAIQSYSVGGAVLRMAIPKTAKIIKYSDLVRKIGHSNPPNFRDSGGSYSNSEQWRGIHATLAGYDAIEVDNPHHGKGYYVILNRGIVTVQKEDAKGHVIK